MSKAKILIVEDEPAIACDIAINLESHDYEIVDIIHNAEEVEEVLKTKSIDLVMLDINLEGEMTGIDLARIIDKQYGVPFIFLTSYADNDTLDKAAGTFPASYLVKPFKEHDLAPAVKITLARKKGDKINRLPSLQIINKNILSGISKAEYAIMEQLWVGKTNPEIAEILFLSKNTVKTHVRNIYSKLDVHSKPGLIKYLRELK